MSELKNIKKHQYNYLTNNRIECRGNSSSAVDFYKVENYAMRVDMKTHVFYAMADLMTISDMYRADIANSGYISNDVEYRPKREFLADKPSESFLDTIAVEYAPSNIPKIQFEPG